MRNRYTYTHTYCTHVAKIFSESNKLALHISEDAIGIVYSLKLVGFFFYSKHILSRKADAILSQRPWTTHHVIRNYDQISKPMQPRLHPVKAVEQQTQVFCDLELRTIVGNTQSVVPQSCFEMTCLPFANSLCRAWVKSTNQHVQ